MKNKILTLLPVILMCIYFPIAHAQNPFADLESALKDIQKNVESANSKSRLERGRSTTDQLERTATEQNVHSDRAHRDSLGESSSNLSIDNAISQTSLLNLSSYCNRVQSDTTVQSYVDAVKKSTEANVSLERLLDSDDRILQKWAIEKIKPIKNSSLVDIMAVINECAFSLRGTKYFSFFAQKNGTDELKSFESRAQPKIKKELDSSGKLIEVEIGNNTRDWRRQENWIIKPVTITNSRMGSPPPAAAFALLFEGGTQALASVALPIIEKIESSYKNIKIENRSDVEEKIKTSISDQTESSPTQISSVTPITPDISVNSTPVDQTTLPTPTTTQQENFESTPTPTPTAATPALAETNQQSTNNKFDFEFIIKILITLGIVSVITFLSLRILKVPENRNKIAVFLQEIHGSLLGKISSTERHTRIILIFISILIAVSIIGYSYNEAGQVQFMWKITIMALVAMIIYGSYLGFSKRAVIYFDKTDTFLALMVVLGPLLAAILGFIIDEWLLNKWITEALGKNWLTYFSAMTSAAFVFLTLSRSAYHNREEPSIVLLSAAMAKVTFGIIYPIVLFVGFDNVATSYKGIQRADSSYDLDKRVARFAGKAAVFIVIVTVGTWLLSKFINGPEVYERRGWWPEEDQG